MFTGQEIDEKTGLVYFGARFYDPDIGRFINQDSYLGKSDTPPSLHRYLYAYSNPTMYVDLFGYNSSPYDDAKSESGNAPRFGDSTGKYRSDGTTVGESLDSSGSSASTPNTKQRRKEAECRAAGGGYECVGSANDEIQAKQTAKDRTKRTETAENSTLDGNKRLHTSEERLKEIFSFKGFMDDDAYQAYKKAYDNGNAAEAAKILALNLLKRTKQGQLLDATATCLKNPSIACLDGINKRSKSKNKKNGNDCCGPSCFAAGTLVQTESGLIAIEEVEEGQLVAARDEETGNITWKPVTALFQYDDDRVTYALTLLDDNGYHEVYEVTDNHPFNVDGIGWVDSIDLEPGLLVPSYYGGLLEVISLEALNRSPITYNFEVADYHTYFVGELGAWVHNTGACVCDDSTLSYTQKKKEYIRIGNKLKLSNKHIFLGERKLNPSTPSGYSGGLKGFHHVGRNPLGHTFTWVGTPNSQGVYQAKWLGYGKAGGGKMSTFFPNNWTKKEVGAAIRQAAGSAVHRRVLTRSSAKRWKFKARVRGVTIEGYLSKSKKTIITAYPIY